MTTLQEIDRLARANGRMPAPRTIDQVRKDLEHDFRKGDGTDLAMARMMVNGGNLTDEAREFARAWLAMYGE